MHNVIFRDIQMYNSKSYLLIIAPAAGTLPCLERAEIVFASIRKPCCRWMFQWWGWQAGLKCTLGADSGCPAHRNTLWESLQKRNNPDKQPVKKKQQQPYPWATHVRSFPLLRNPVCISFLPIVAVKSRVLHVRRLCEDCFFSPANAIRAFSASDHSQRSRSTATIM